MRRKHRSRISNVGYYPVSPFIDRKVFEYSINLVNSVYLTQKTGTVFDFLVELVGRDQIEQVFTKVVKERKPQLLEKFIGSDPCDYEFEYSDLKKTLGKRGIERTITAEILPILENYQQKCAKVTVTDKKLAEIKKVFRLNKTEMEILSFLFIRENSPFLHASIDCIDSFNEKVVFLNSVGTILNIDKRDIQRACRKGSLSKSELVDFDRCIDLPDWMSDFLAGLSVNLNENFFAKFKGKALDLEHHLIDSRETEILKEFTAQKGPVDLLFHGEPGTGKTELAKSLATFSGKDLFIINNKENEDTKDMKQAIIATCNIADPAKSIILVDEADDLLNTSCSFFSFMFHSKEKNSKSWMNHFMDENKHKVIWITNRSDEIESSTMRRFAFSMKFKRFTVRKKLRVFKYCLEQRGLQNIFSEEELLKICSRYSINAGGIADALKNLKVRKNGNKEKFLARLDTILKNHQTAITGVEFKGNRMKELKEYSIEALNTSESLDCMVSTTRRFLDFTANSESEKRASMNILLYGMPGSGKTEFVKYLGQTLQKEIVLKRASDLISMWVGESEKLIAQAFDEAEGNQSILFLDEADTFFFPREEATRSWEKSQTNELLTQMENFNGVLICATNFLKGLDQAALRRFKFKVEFKPLTAKGNLDMYHTVLSSLIKQRRLSTAEEEELRQIKNLTPGDFHVVAEKYTFMDKSAMSHDALIQSLKNELKHKPKESSIGFAA